MDWKNFQKRYECQVKIRSTHQPVAAVVYAIHEHQAKVDFHQPEYGVSFGQACVFYQQDHVLGGGWISRESYR